MKLKKIALLALLLTSIIACNKEKNFSNKLMKGDKWNVKEIKVENQSINIFGVWNITQAVNIYDVVPEALWNDDGEKTKFKWQFQNKGKNFQLNYLHDVAYCDSTTLSNLDFICYDLSGTYKVEQHKKKEMRFTSTQTLGYNGKDVVISIEKQ